MNEAGEFAESRTRRLFFALWPSDDVRHSIEHETRTAARHSGGRMIPARNFHITLAFLGSVPEERVADVQAVAAALSVVPFDLIMGRVIWWERQELLCMEPTAGLEALNELAARLQRALRASGFVLESRPFRAHLTLARDVRREHAIKPIRAVHWTIDRVALVESQTLERGSVYTVLE